MLAALLLAVFPPMTHNYRDVLSLVGTPTKRDQTDISIFSDQGAWFGFALPGDDRWNGGFSGPFIIEPFRWVGPCLAKFDLGSALHGAHWQTHSEPGALVETADAGNLRVELKLVFANNRSATTLATVTNRGPVALEINPSWTGEAWEARLSSQGSCLTAEFEGSSVEQVYSGSPSFHLEDRQFSVALPPVELNPGKSAAFSLQQTYHRSKEEPRAELADPPSALVKASSRWQKYLQAIEAAHLDEPHARLAVKCIETLITNWRCASGDILHDGCFPSYITFQAFWPWDSWKHAAALASVDPELAKDQIRAIFDHMDDDGMLPDTIHRDKSENNLRNTKPPLATWAVWHIYEQTRDKAFLREILPSLKKYHHWWYRFRDHDQDGICEFGSTDGTLQAAAWESGMDNAVRFDGMKLTQNSEHAWSLNQESVDLNCFLAYEKQLMSRILEELGASDEAVVWSADAKKLGEKIRQQFWNEEDGWFYDTDLEGKPIRVAGPEGWAPLWAGLASPEEARRLRDTMMDPRRFFTKVPLPTLDASRPEFDPANGYWRGPVWLDQVYFGIRGLQRYGFEKDAAEIQRALFENAEGLMGDAPIRENYHPTSGEGLYAKHFGWSAAHILMLLLGK